MKKRKFIKLALKLSCLILTIPFLPLINLDKIKKIVYKKKFSKIWILDINDN